MFGIGILELFIVLIVALFVIGPDKLPEVARTFGHMVRSVRQFFYEIKTGMKLGEEYSAHPMASDASVDAPDKTKYGFVVPEIFPNEEGEKEIPHTIKKGKG